MELGWWMGHAIRAARDRVVGGAGRARHAAVRRSRGRSPAISAALRPRAGRRGVPRRPRARADGLSLARKGRVHRGTHAACRAAGGTGRRGARPIASRLRELATGAIVHDIGKLAVPDEILKKPGEPDRRGVRGDQAPPGVGLPDAPIELGFGEEVRPSSAATTNGSTAPAIPAAAERPADLPRRPDPRRL